MGVAIRVYKAVKSNKITTPPHKMPRGTFSIVVYIYACGTNTDVLSLYPSFASVWTKNFHQFYGESEISLDLINQ